MNELVYALALCSSFFIAGFSAGIWYEITLIGKMLDIDDKLKNGSSDLSIRKHNWRKKNE